MAHVRKQVGMAVRPVQAVPWKGCCAERCTCKLHIISPHFFSSYLMKPACLLALQDYNV